VKSTRGDDQCAPGHGARAAPRRGPVWCEVTSGVSQTIRQPNASRVIAVRVGHQATSERTFRGAAVQRGAWLTEALDQVDEASSLGTGDSRQSHSGRRGKGRACA
jgi:hypothetical protein